MNLKKRGFQVQKCAEIPMRSYPLASSRIQSYPVDADIDTDIETDIETDTDIDTEKENKNEKENEKNLT